VAKPRKSKKVVPVAGGSSSDTASPNIASGGRFFGEPVTGPDATSFEVDNTSVQYYNSPYYKLHQKMLKDIPPPRSGVPGHMRLEEVIGTVRYQEILAAGKLIFHAAGDTGAVDAKSMLSEESVADLIAKDFSLPAQADHPSFFYHLGDVVYHFGEDQFYYDQFYKPFRLYDAPIFAVPGNHDGVTYDKSTKPLDAFLKNFCSPQPIHPPEAGTLVRTAMTQPGVYFTLDAPFISIIGLYSNVLEGPGVISSEGGKYPVKDDQKAFLISELKRLKAQRTTKEIAVFVALHHPPLSGDSIHGGSTGLIKDLDDAFNKAGLWPDVVLSGHAHIYQRFSRSVNGKEITYITAGSGGFALSKMKVSANGPALKTPYTVKGSDHTLMKYIHAFGCLKVTARSKVLEITFDSPDKSVGISADSFTINL
jgi:predicted phosphodiesterase